MGDQVSKISGTVGLDVSQYKASLAEMNRGIRLLESAFRANAAEFTNWRGSATAVEDRIQTLNSQIEIQTNRVALLTAEHEKLAAAYGADSQQAQDMQFKVQGATRDLNKMQTELGQDQTQLQYLQGNSAEAGTALAVMGLAADGAKAALAGLREVAASLVLVFQALALAIQAEFVLALGALEVGIGAIVGVLAVGAGAVFGLGAALVIATAGLAGLTFKAADTAKQLEELSIKTNIPIERLQELGFIGNLVGTDLDTLATANARLVKNMSSAKAGTGAAAKAFKELGISVTDSAGNLRDSDVVFGEAIDALGKVTNETEQAALAQAIFGRGAQDLLPLIRLGAKGMEEYAAMARLVGYVVSEETVKALAALSVKAKAVKLGLEGLGVTILAAFAPFWNGALDSVIGYIVQLAGIVRDANGDFGKLADGLGGLFSKVISDIAGALPDLLNSGLQIVQSVINSIEANLPTIANAAVSIVNSLATFITNNLPLLGSVAGRLLETLRASIIPMLPQLADVGIGIITILAGALVNALPGLADAALSAVNTIANSITAQMPHLQSVASSILTTLAPAILRALPVLVGVGLSIALALISAIVDALPTLLPALADAGLQIVTMLAEAIGKATPQLASAAKQIIPAIIDFLYKDLVMLLAVGIPLISQLIQAILPALPMLLSAALLILTALANGISQQMPVLMPVIIQVLQELVNVLAFNAPMMTQAAMTLMTALINGFAAAAPSFYAQMPNLVWNILMALAGMNAALFFGGLSMAGAVLQGWLNLAILAFGAGVQFVTNILAGIQQNVPQMYSAAVNLINQALAGARSKLGEWASIGQNIVQGIWKGIQSLAGWLYAQVTQFAAGIAAAAQAALQGHSPSMVFYGIGQDTIKGFSLGFFEGLDALQRQANMAMRGFAGSVAVQAAGFGGNSSVQNSDDYTFYAPVYVQGSMPAGSLGARLKARTY